MSFNAIIQRHGTWLVPAAHALVKSNGESVSGQWSVRNDGDTAAFALLHVTLGAQEAFGPIVSVAPGQTVLLAHTLSGISQPDGTTVAGEVMIHQTDSAGNLIRHVAIHPYTVAVLRSRVFTISGRFFILNETSFLLTPGTFILWSASLGTDLAFQIEGTYLGPSITLRAQVVGGVPFRVVNGPAFEIVNPTTPVPFVLNAANISWPAGTYAVNQQDSFTHALQEFVPVAFVNVPDIPGNPDAYTILFT